MPDTPTTRLSLYKSASDGSEDVDYTQDLGNNWDTLDQAVGALAVTTSTFPSAPWSGQLVRDTDTDRLWVSNGTSPASGSWSEITTPGTEQTFTAGILLQDSTDTTAVLYAQVTGDTKNRVSIHADGSLNWGSGSANPDTNLYRSAADTLKTDDSLVVAGDLAVNGTISATGDLTADNYAVILDWTTPTMATGYTANGNSNGTPQYRVINLLGTKFVQWRGGIGVTYSGGDPVNSGMPFDGTLNALAIPSSTRTVAAACSASSSTSLSVKVDFTTSGGAIIIIKTDVNPPWVSLNDIMYSL